MDTPPAAPTAKPWTFFQALRVLAITLFVCFQLGFLLVRNVSDMWYEELVNKRLKTLPWWDVTIARMYRPYPVEPKWVDVSVGKVFSCFDWTTDRYAHFFGIKQGWSMFGPPVARKAPFLGAEVELNDGTTDLLKSPNEFDPNGYVRLGGWRQRKLEDYMIFETPDSIPGKSDPQIFEAYVRWTARRWRAAHPDDPREVVRIHLIRRTIHFPDHGGDLTHFRRKEELIGTFTPDGTFVPTPPRRPEPLPVPPEEPQR